MKKFILIAVVMSCAFASEFYALPVQGYKTLTAGFNTPRPYGLHQALDIACARYATVSATMPGTVIKCDYDKTLGNYIKIRLDNGNTQVYAHLQRTYRIWPGDYVQKGQKIGEAGDTGSARGVHLHFAEFDKQGLAVKTTSRFGITWALCGNIYLYQSGQ